MDKQRLIAKLPNGSSVYRINRPHNNDQLLKEQQLREAEFSKQFALLPKSLKQSNYETP